MKNWIKKNKSKCWIIIVVLFMSAVIAFLYCKGFRITYAPEIDSNWTAVSTVAACISAFGAVSAVIAAFIVANKQNEIAEKQASIANQQNRIALFEKRYSVIEEISKHISFALFIKESQDIYDDMNAVARIFMCDYDVLANDSKLRLLLHQFSVAIYSAQYIFDNISNEDCNYFNLYTSDYLFALAHNESNVQECKGRYVGQALLFQEKYMENMYSALKI